MNSVHFNCVVGVVTKENNLDLLAAILPPLSSRMVLMLLTYNNTILIALACLIVIVISCASKDIALRTGEW